jgi:hypothetical protein
VTLAPDLSHDLSVTAYGTNDPKSDHSLSDALFG